MRCAQTSRFGNRRSSRRTADGCAAQGGSEGCERGRGSGAHRPAPGAAVTSRRGAVGGSSAEACRSAAPPIAPLPSRRVAASRGQYRWCGGGGSLHRPAAGAAITSMRGGCRRLVWLEAYAAPPKPYCRSSAWRLGRAAVVVADGIWRRRRRLALPSGRNSDPAALAGGRAYIFIDSKGIRAAVRPLVRGCFQVLRSQPKDDIIRQKDPCALPIRTYLCM